MNSPALLCLVVAIADGDTLTARCEVQGEQQTIVVRLSQMDAPERRQPWGDRSRQHLAALCFQKSATVREEAHDRYQRMVARVDCEGIEANAEQVRAGMAWVFDRYVTDRALYAVQAEAKEAKRGLWGDAAPVPPWEWRRPLQSGELEPLPRSAALQCVHVFDSRLRSIERPCVAGCACLLGAAGPGLRDLLPVVRQEEPTGPPVVNGTCGHLEVLHRGGGPPVPRSLLDRQRRWRWTLP